MKVSQPVSSNGNRQRMNKEPDPQVVPKAERRKFSAEYKLHILAKADECTERGQNGALLRREGLYSSNLDKWRKQRARGALEGLGGRKRGRKPDPQATEIARLQRDNEQLRARLERAEHIIEVQKKLAQLLGTMSTGMSNSERP
jgi:transposase-like protein